MAREHPSVPKASSSQKRGMMFDGESDDEDNAGAQSKKVALSKKQSLTKDMSNLFVKEINGEEQPIQFYIVENDGDWDATVDLRNQITDCGGECVEERPKEGYTLVDPRTEEGELEISSFSTPKRRVVSFRFVEESIKRGSLVPTMELVLFIKEDRPVKFHLHDSLKEEEIERLRDDILLRGGNPDVELSEAQVVIHSRDFRDKLIVNRRWRQIELFETSDWLKSCMTTKRFSITGAGGRLTVAPAPRPVPAAQPGRRPGAPRTDFTDHDDMCLVIWMAYQFGKNHAGRQGNRPYQVLVQDPDQTWWTSRHTWHSWRERYKNKRAHLDPLIIQAVNEREQNRKPNHRERRLPKFPDSDDESEVEQEGVAQEVAAPEAEPSKTRAKPKPRKRKTQAASDDEDEQPEPKPAPAKQVERVTKRVKVGSQPNLAIKVSASQKAREAPPPRTPTPPPSSQARPSPGPPSSGPPSPGPEPPRAIVVPVREESPVTQPDEDQEREDSQSSTQLENGILDQAVFGGGARGAVERHNAELARMAADELDELNESEGYTFDDPDVDVVGITQVDSSPSINVDLSRQTGADESTTESTSEWGEDEEAGETGETVLDTIEERLTALADGFGAMYSKVEAYYQLARGDGMDEAAAYDFAEKQLRANSRQEKGKGRAS